jgi:putative pyoverdin transport system ATP-binding/permease protein
MRPLMKAREAADSLQVHFQGLTRGVKELKLHRERRRAFLSEVMHETAGSLRTHNISGLRIFAAAASWGQTIVIIVVGIFVFGLPAFKIVDSQIMTGYALILLYLMTPIQVLITSLPTLGRATVAINKIDALGLSLSASGSDDDANSIAEKNGAWKSLDLAGVTHTYHSEDSAFTLGPIDLTLKPGEVVFLVGGNGSGKTTLAKLLVGLYAPESGQVKLNGRAVTTESRDDYRQLFSVVFFDFFLFESLLGLETEGLDQKAREYLESLQLSHKVKVNHGRLSTTELSAGQRKRLALLTAYLEDRPIYVFDEWAADQDPIFKDIFYYHIVSGLRDRAKTVVVISHDDRYYHLGDRIIKLENGMVEYDKLVSPVLAAKSETVAY